MTRHADGISLATTLVNHTSCSIPKAAVLESSKHHQGVQWRSIITARSAHVLLRFVRVNLAFSIPVPEYHVMKTSWAKRKY